MTSSPPDRRQAAAPQAFFLDALKPGGGQRFCMVHAPCRQPVAGGVVYVHPWLEEMNKSRRMAALQSRLLAQAGYAVIQIDLMGCGDSSGELAEATWADWVDDVCLAARWIGDRHDAPLWLWGLRSGCLLACSAAPSLAKPAQWLFWQPPAQGRPLLAQFLRLKAAAEIHSGKGQEVLASTRSRLAAGEPVEIAGYRVSASLANGLESATLAPPAGNGRVEWLEVSPREDPALLPASAGPASGWRASGWQVRAQAVGGPMFWQTSEIEDAPALLEATLAALSPSQPP